MIFRTGFLLALTSLAAIAQDAPKPVEVLTYLEPYRSIEISPQETGAIESIAVEEGATVKAGDVLVKLESTVIEARRAIAAAQAENQGRLQAASAEVEISSKRYNLLKNLQRSSSNRAELDRQSATLQSAEGNLLTAQEDQKAAVLNVAQIDAELERRILRSPIDGIVVEIAKDVAESVSAGGMANESYLIRVVQVDRLKAVAHVPAESADGLKAGDQLPIRVQTKGDPMVSGTIEFVSPIIHPSSKTVAVRIAIDNANRAIRGGTSGFVILEQNLAAQ